MRWEGNALKGGEDRFWSLVEQRAAPDADVEAVDRRIWELFGEDWAIVFTDLAGFSRDSKRFGITHFLQLIFEHKRLLLPIVAKFDGIVIKVIADSLLLVFRRPDAALRCAIEMNRACQHVNQRRFAEERILLCAGIGFGRVLRVGDQDVFGEEVNAASKLGEDTAKPGQILLTEATRTALGEPAGVTFREMGIAVPGSARNFHAVYDADP